MGLDAPFDRLAERLGRDRAPRQQIAAGLGQIDLDRPVLRLTADQRRPLHGAGETPARRRFLVAVDLRGEFGDAIQEQQERCFSGGDPLNLAPSRLHRVRVSEREPHHRRETLGRELLEDRIGDVGGYWQGQRGHLLDYLVGPLAVEQGPHVRRCGEPEAVAVERRRGGVVLRVDLRPVSQLQHAAKADPLVADTSSSALVGERELRDRVEVAFGETGALVGDVEDPRRIAEVEPDEDSAGRLGVQSVMSVLDQFEDGTTLVFLSGVLGDRLEAFGEPPVISGLLEQLDPLQRTSCYGVIDPCWVHGVVHVILAPDFRRGGQRRLSAEKRSPLSEVHQPAAAISGRPARCAKQQVSPAV